MGIVWVDVRAKKEVRDMGGNQLVTILVVVILVIVLLLLLSRLL
jgi:competence protein ComGC